VLHKHRTIEGDRRLGEFELPFGAAGCDALGENLRGLLVGLLG
jgi:hypothetical protein